MKDETYIGHTIHYRETNISFKNKLYGRTELEKYDKAIKAYAEKILPGLMAEMNTNEEYSLLWENEEFRRMTEEISEHFGTQ